MTCGDDGVTCTFRVHHESTTVAGGTGNYDWSMSLYGPDGVKVQPENSPYLTDFHYDTSREEGVFVATKKEGDYTFVGRFWNVEDSQSQAYSDSWANYGTTMVIEKRLTAGAVPESTSSAMETLLSTKRGEKETASETGIIVGLEVY